MTAPGMTVAELVALYARAAATPVPVRMDVGPVAYEALRAFGVAQQDGPAALVAPRWPPVPVTVVYDREAVEVDEWRMHYSDESVVGGRLR